MKLSEEGFVVMDVRIGRLNKLDDYFKKYPEKLNQKIFPSQEFGTPTQHSAIELAVLFGHPATLRWLVKKGATESSSSSPNLLVLAVNQQNDDMLKTVTDLGFDPWSPSVVGISPVALAASLGWDRGLALWRQSGVSLKKKDKIRRHALS